MLLFSFYGKNKLINFTGLSSTLFCICSGPLFSIITAREILLLQKPIIMASKTNRLTQNRDIEILAASEFKKQLSTLTFVGGREFHSVDSNGICSFSLKEKFHDTGDYPFNALVTLVEIDTNLNLLAKLYNISGTLSLQYIGNKDDKPLITFNNDISCHVQ